MALSRFDRKCRRRAETGIPFSEFVFWSMESDRILVESPDPPAIGFGRLDRSSSNLARFSMNALKSSDVSKVESKRAENLEDPTRDV
jgi:hypothetical protein